MKPATLRCSWDWGHAAAEWARLISQLTPGPGLTTTVTFNDSSDSTGRTITIGHPSSNDWTVSGMSPTPVAIHGSLPVFSFMGGSGNNTLVGPNETSSWLIDGANSGKFDRIHSFSGIRNIVSGSANDSILFKTAGSLAGNLDGGAGTDSVNYQNGMLTGSDVIDLPNHIAPRVAGQALNLETSGKLCVACGDQPRFEAIPGRRANHAVHGRYLRRLRRKGILGDELAARHLD